MVALVVGELGQLRLGGVAADGGHDGALLSGIRLWGALAGRQHGRQRTTTRWCRAARRVRHGNATGLTSWRKRSCRPRAPSVCDVQAPSACDVKKGGDNTPCE